MDLGETKTTAAGARRSIAEVDFSDFGDVSAFTLAAPEADELSLLDPCVSATRVFDHGEEPVRLTEHFWMIRAPSDSKTLRLTVHTTAGLGVSA